MGLLAALRPSLFNASCRTFGPGLRRSGSSSHLRSHPFDCRPSPADLRAMPSPPRLCLNHPTRQDFRYSLGVFAPCPLPARAHAIVLSSVFGFMGRRTFALHPKMAPPTLYLDHAWPKTKGRVRPGAAGLLIGIEYSRERDSSWMYLTAFATTRIDVGLAAVQRKLPNCVVVGLQLYSARIFRVTLSPRIYKGGQGPPPNIINT